MERIFEYAASERPDKVVVCSTGGSLTSLSREDCRVDGEEKEELRKAMEEQRVELGEELRENYCDYDGCNYDYNHSKEDSKSEYEEQRLRKGGYTVLVKKRGGGEKIQQTHTGPSRAMEAFVCGALIVGGAREMKAERGGTSCPPPSPHSPPLSSSPTSVCEMIRCWGMCPGGLSLPPPPLQAMGKVEGAWLGDLRELKEDLGF
jgi:hypothetical protein